MENQTPLYQLDLWQYSDWKKSDRHYTCRLSQNIFGDWLVTRSWGTINSNRGNCLETIHASYEDALVSFQQAETRRVKRGYQNRLSPTR